MVIKTKFINFLMKQLDLTVNEMKYFLGVKSKTVYNYRQMSFKELPEKVKMKFYHLFNLNDGNKIKEKLSSMNHQQLLELRELLLINVRLRYNLMDPSFHKNLQKNYLQNKGTSKNNNIVYSNEYWKKIKNNYENYNRFNQKNNNYIINIKSDVVSDLYIKVLETELNNKIKTDDYEFIAYLKNYKKRI